MIEFEAYFVACAMNLLVCKDISPMARLMFADLDDCRSAVDRVVADKTQEEAHYPVVMGKYYVRVAPDHAPPIA